MFARWSWVPGQKTRNCLSKLTVLNNIKKVNLSRSAGDRKRRSAAIALPRVLFVDDSEDIIDLYTASLSDSYQVVAVSKGREAVDCCGARPIDAAVVDYMLPDLSGIEVMKQIKEIAPSIPVIIVTAYGDEDIAVQSFRNGARDYLKKPFSMSELCAKIDFFLALKNADKKARKNAVFEQRNTDAPKIEVTFNQYHKIQNAVKYINDHYRTDIRLEKTAEEIGMSNSHFSRIFKKVMGIAFLDYVHGRRIAKAQTLLRTTAMTITEIASFLGYSDATGFGRIFKITTGVTPSSYRELPRKE